MKNKNILLIENNKFLRASLHIFLRKNGYDVLPVSNSEEGLNLYLEQVGDKYKIDLIISDIKMAGTSLIDFIESIKPLDILPPILVITEDADLELERELSSRGYNYLLNKPFTSEELMAKINHLLSKPAKTQTGLVREIEYR